MNRLLPLILLMIGGLAEAGTQCKARAPQPQQWAAATRTALTAVAELERRDAPLAMIARVGTDLSKQGVHYSHAGFVVRDHPDGRWTVVHLLNRCGTDSSALHAEGLINFFGDHLVSQDSRIVWFVPERSAALLALLTSSDIHRLHEPHYNLIAHPSSRKFQNSTAWLLDVLAASTINGNRKDRPDAQRAARSLGYQPYILHIPYSKRIAGGLFAANMHFGDHSVGARLSGEYPVVTVDSLFDWMDQIGWIESDWSLPTTPGERR